MSKYNMSVDLGNGNDEDVIVIHLGHSLSEEQFNEVSKSIIAFLNQRWPDLQNYRFTN